MSAQEAVLLPLEEAMGEFEKKFAAAGGKGEPAGAWGGEACADVAPHAPTFAQRSVEETDRFVLEALDKAGEAGEGTTPKGGAVEGELDALAFAMGALWELAADCDVNQARAWAALLRGRGGAPNALARVRTWADAHSPLLRA
jgi:hypothetical protein